MYAYWKEGGFNLNNILSFMKKWEKGVLKGFGKKSIAR